LSGGLRLLTTIELPPGESRAVYLEMQSLTHSKFMGIKLQVLEETTRKTAPIP
jgi:hypothetical protein